MAYARKEEKSLGELFSDLSSGLQELYKKEFDLAKKEIYAKIARSVSDIKYLAIGGVLMYVGFLAIAGSAIALIWTLAEIPVWLSALIVGAVLAVCGYFVLRKGRKDLKRFELTPKETISSLKEDAKWVKRKI